MDDFVPNTDDMPEEFADPEGDAELHDPALALEATTTSLRNMWADWLCHKGSGRFADPKFFGKGIGGVPVVAVDAFRALETALTSSGYKPSSSWAYNCRNIGGTDRYSLHSYGIAIDIDPSVNPFSTGDPYSGRIKANHVEAVLAIKNKEGQSVWSWGGNWKKRDRMHFQLDQDPNNVDVDWSTVPGATTTTILEEKDAGLTEGAEGDEVTKFQQRLLAWNPEALPKYGADGDYGAETTEWVKIFQNAMGLSATGNIDATTATMLEGGLTQGATGDAVTGFQKRLLAWNHEALPKYGADGDYGGETTEWVKKFQEADGLDANGNIDAVTATALTAA
jgi:peptidoglycan hydrolase-like protein with peptidoglycan-binding domain